MLFSKCFKGAGSTFVASCLLANFSSSGVTSACLFDNLAFKSCPEQARKLDSYVKDYDSGRAVDFLLQSCCKGGEYSDLFSLFGYLCYAEPYYSVMKLLVPGDKCKLSDILGLSKGEPKEVKLVEGAEEVKKGFLHKIVFLSEVMSRLSRRVFGDSEKSPEVSEENLKIARDVFCKFIVYMYQFTHGPEALNSEEEFHSRLDLINMVGFVAAGCDPEKYVVYPRQASIWPRLFGGYHKVAMILDNPDNPIEFKDFDFALDGEGIMFAPKGTLSNVSSSILDLDDILGNLTETLAPKIYYGF